MVCDVQVLSAAPLFALFRMQPLHRGKVFAISELFTGSFFFLVRSFAVYREVLNIANGSKNRRMLSEFFCTLRVFVPESGTALA